MENFRPHAGFASSESEFQQDGWVICMHNEVRETPV